VHCQASRTEKSPPLARSWLPTFERNLLHQHSFKPNPGLIILCPHGGSQAEGTRFRFCLFDLAFLVVIPAGSAFVGFFALFFTFSGPNRGMSKPIKAHTPYQPMISRGILVYTKTAILAYIELKIGKRKSRSASSGRTLQWNILRVNSFGCEYIFTRAVTHRQTN